MWLVNQQHQHPLGAFPHLSRGPNPDLLNQNLYFNSQAICILVWFLMQRQWSVRPFIRWLVPDFLCHSPIENPPPLEMANRTLEFCRSFSLATLFFYFLVSSTLSQIDYLLLGLSDVIISSIKFSQPYLLLCPCGPIKDYIMFCNLKYLRCQNFYLILWIPSTWSKARRALKMLSSTVNESE